MLKQHPPQKKKQRSVVASRRRMDQTYSSSEKKKKKQRGERENTKKVKYIFSIKMKSFIHLHTPIQSLQSL